MSRPMFTRPLRQCAIATEVLGRLIEAGVPLTIDGARNGTRFRKESVRLSLILLQNRGYVAGTDTRPTLWEPTTTGKVAYYVAAGMPLPEPLVARIQSRAESLVT